jgi:hypothetical protein
MANIAIFNFTPVYDNGQWKNLHYYNSIILAFKKRGHNVCSFITNEILCDPWNGNNVSISKEADNSVEIKLKKFKPDLIISFNNSKPRFVEKFDCPIVIAEADTAQYFSEQYLIKENVDRYHFFYFTNNGLNQIANRFNASKKRIFYIENATSIKSKQISKVNEISFIGTLYNCRFDHINLKNKKSAAYLNYITAKERKEILLSLKDYQLKIYTNKVPDTYYDLRNLNKISKKLTFETSHIEKIMNQSLISLNHSHKQAKNQGYSWRVLDILASNSILITEESNLLIKKFGKNIRKQFYSSVLDVRKVCKYFLDNKNANIDLIAEQNEIIDKFFRWEDRIKKIEDIFGLKSEKNKENSIINFRIKKNPKPTLMISLILRFTKYKKKHIHKKKFVHLLKEIFNKFIMIIKTKNSIMYKFYAKLKYFRHLKNSKHHY